MRLLAGLGSARVLNEPLSSSPLAAMALTMAGVALGSGAVHIRRAAQRA